MWSVCCQRPDILAHVLEHRIPHVSLLHHNNLNKLHVILHNASNPKMTNNGDKTRKKKKIMKLHFQVLYLFQIIVAQRDSLFKLNRSIYHKMDRWI